MALIPEGEFQMGTRYATDEKKECSKNIGHMNAWKDEQPAHTVYVDAYYMDIYPVTNKQYKAFLLANPEWQKGRIDSKYHDGNYLRDWNGNNYPMWKGNHPVTSVCWYAAMTYAEWAGKRLPTEAEWERAARGGLENKRFPWGDSIDESKANYADNIGKTTPVGKYPPNPYGLYDMAGNVWEMALDEYDAHFYSISPGWNPVSGANTIQDIIENFMDVETHRVVRGGAWLNPAPYVRVSDRNIATPKSIGELGGFRCVKDVSDTEEIKPDSIKFISANPPNRTTIKPSAKITLTFNGTPKDIMVNTDTTPLPNSTVTVSNKGTVTILGIFTPTELNLEIVWSEGVKKLVYNVEVPVSEDMVLIPEGEFEMWRNVVIHVDDFYIDRHEVTVGEYKKFVKETGHRSPDWDRIAEYAPTGVHPIIFVDWYDAMLYARWVGKRLPTKIEWEKAARGGLLGKKYPWGDTPPDGTQCNLTGTADSYEHTAPVGSFLANDYGLYDMLGNVGEWCLDGSRSNSNANSAHDNSLTSEEIVEITTHFSKVWTARGVRGGSWFSESYHLHGVYGANIPVTKDPLFGFRCVRPIKP